MLKMEDIVEVKMGSKNFKISWKMTNWCNYRCSYCYMSKSVSETITNTPMEHLLNPAQPKERLIIAPNTPMCTKVSWTSKLTDDTSKVSEKSSNELKPLSQTLKEKMEESIVKRDEEYNSYALTIVENYKKEILEKVDTLTLYSPTTTIDLSSCPHSIVEIATIVERLLNEDGSNFIVGTNFTSITITFE